MRADGRERTGFYTWMLLDDIGKMHYAYDTALNFDGRPDDGANQRLAVLLADFSGDSYRGSRDAAYGLWQLVETVAREHLLYGRCFCELHLAAASDEELIQLWSRPRSQGDGGPSGGVFGVQLGRLPGWSLRVRPFGVRQIAGNHSRWSGVRLPRRHLRPFNLPGDLSAQLHRTYLRLTTADRDRSREIELLRQGSAIGYDSEVHMNTSYELVARATAEIGWDARGLFKERTTSAHLTYRRLRFRRTWLRTVSATVDTVNAITADPRLSNEAPFTVAITGLPTVAEVDAGIQALLEGRESVDSLTNRLLYPRHAKSQTSPTD